MTGDPLGAHLSAAIERLGRAPARRICVACQVLEATVGSRCGRCAALAVEAARGRDPRDAILTPLPVGSTAAGAPRGPAEAEDGAGGSTGRGPGKVREMMAEKVNCPECGKQRSPAYFPRGKAGEVPCKACARKQGKRGARPKLREVAPGLAEALGGADAARVLCGESWGEALAKFLPALAREARRAAAANDPRAGKAAAVLVDLLDLAGKL